MRSNEDLTFDAVAIRRHEVSYDEVGHRYPGPMSKHPVISVKGHPEVIWIRPDLGVGMVANSIAFAVGSPARQIPWLETKRSLKEGYLPIVVSTWSNGSLKLTQTSFATLIGAPKVTTGHEKQVAMIEMTLSNLDTGKGLQANLWVLLPCFIASKGVPPFPYNTYDVFDIPGQLPQIPDRGTKPKDNIFRQRNLSLGIYRADPSALALSHNGAWSFHTDLPPGATKTLHFLVTSSARGLEDEEIESLQQLDIARARQQREASLEAILHEGTQIDVPDRIVNDIYKAQILHTQSQILQAADKDYCVPVQGYQGVWPWEAMKLTVHLDSIGHHEDARKCLEYFLHVQGQFPPHGTFKSSRGTFGGTIAFKKSGWERDSRSTLYGQLAKLNAKKEKEFPNWMNGTGALLHAFAIHYRYTRDEQWLRRVAPALLRACNWIITERQATKQKNENGEKPLHYGLLPIGRAYDTAEEAIRQLTSEGELVNGEFDSRHAPLDTYYPPWTDSYSSLGLTSIADALREIEHPESPYLIEEAKAYRDDILEVMKRTRSSDPDSPPYPERLYQTAAWAEFATGALAYLDTGFMDPTDSAFEQLERYMKKKWNRGVLGLTGGMEKNGDPHGEASYYVNFSEDIWHRGWLQRGETEKALLAFYSMLAYGMDQQTFGTVERFHVSDTRYAPFFMDTSAGARVCGLIRQALLLEVCGDLRLLAGIPRAWLEDGQSIKVTNGIATSARLDLNVESRVDRGEILVAVTVSNVRTNELTGMRLRLPHPQRKRMKSVAVNGKGWNRLDAEREVIELDPQAGLTSVLVTY